MAASQSHRCYLNCTDRLIKPNLGDRLDFELEEAEVWATSDNTSGADPQKLFSNPRLLRKPVWKCADVDLRPIVPRSLPVNIPDWSKILRGEYIPRAVDDCESGEEEDRVNDRIPPHEYLARTRDASPSVHEGIGRTLKGRDLSRVRNAIWKKTGFED